MGEFGQEVLGCRCAGGTFPPIPSTSHGRCISRPGKTTHGNCGYHFHFMSNEDCHQIALIAGDVWKWSCVQDKPWCRTKFGPTAKQRNRTRPPGAVRRFPGCGHYSIKGNWVYCDPRGTERRRADAGCSASGQQGASIDA